jgi:DNA replication protein DnaC
MALTVPKDVIERFASLDLLIIDEVGVQFGSPTEIPSCNYQRPL